MLDTLNYPIIWYVIGILSAIVAYLAWNWLRLIMANRSLRAGEDAHTFESTSPSEQQKQALKQRLQPIRATGPEASFPPA